MKPINPATPIDIVETESEELFPQLTKRPGKNFHLPKRPEPSSSGIHQIMQQNQDWYQTNITTISENSRDTIPDEELSQTELSELMEADKKRNNSEYLKSMLKVINEGIIGVSIQDFGDISLTHLGKLRLAKKTQSEVIKYLRLFYAEEYRVYVSAFTIRECLEKVKNPEWKGLECLIQGQNTLKELLT